MAGSAIELEVGDRTVRLSSPDRVYFPARGETKLDLARYYIAVGDGHRARAAGPARACCTASRPG